MNIMDDAGDFNNPDGVSEQNWDLEAMIEMVFQQVRLFLLRLTAVCQYKSYMLLRFVLIPGTVTIVRCEFCGTRPLKDD